MKVVFTGGGTGGHIYPALAIREILQNQHNFDSAYIGVAGGLEEKIVSRIDGLPFYGVRAQGMPRTASLKWLSFPLVNFLGIMDAWGHIRRFKPDFVVATGGYVAFPVLFVCRILGIKYVIHEQNAAMGMTNKLFARSAAQILLTYGSAAKADGKTVLTGNPVRAEFLKPTSSSGRFNVDGYDFVVLSVGGSRGALSVNRAVLELAREWLPQKPEVKFIHISGERDHKMIKAELSEPPPNYELLPYLHEMKEAFDVADLIISRAGATILSEIAVCGKPAILVPFPHATDNHQEKNARVLEEAGAACLVADSELSGQRLAHEIENLRSGNRLSRMSAAMKKSRPPDVEDKIATRINLVIDSLSS